MAMFHHVNVSFLQGPIQLGQTTVPSTPLTLPGTMASLYDVILKRFGTISLWSLLPYSSHHEISSLQISYQKVNMFGEFFSAIHLVLP